MELCWERSFAAITSRFTASLFLDSRLEEFKAAEAANKLVIPVALGDMNYASDIIHKSMGENRRMFEAFRTDPGYQAKQGQNLSAEYLTEDRLARLHMGETGVEIVANTVIEILRDYRLNVLSHD